MCILSVDPRSSGGNVIARTRTVKAMQAALAGVPLVSAAWISSCRQAKALTVPSSSMFIRSLPIKTSDSHANSDYGVACVAATIQRSGTNYCPLRGHFVHLCGPFSRQKQADISLLLRQSGAEIVSHPSAVLGKVRALSDDGEGKVVLVCDDSTNSGISSALERDVKLHKRNVLIATSIWLFDSISCGKALSAGAYKPRSRKAKELWEATKDMN